MSSEICKRPEFTEEQITKELQRVTIVDEILAEHGPLRTEQLFEAITEIDRKGEFFYKLSELQEFVQLRSNAFEASYNIVRNRSREFREMFGYLINFLCREPPAKRNIRVAAEALKDFEKIVAYEIGPDPSDILDFFEKHPNFFELNVADGTLKLRPSCVQIPSAWERGALPVYKKAIRYDRSVQLTGIGHVVSAVTSTRYVKIEITKGRWSKQTVYGLSKNVSNEENIAEKYPVGSVVKVCAFRAYDAAQPWTAYKIEADFTGDKNDIWTAKRTFKTLRNLEVTATTNGEVVRNVLEYADSSVSQSEREFFMKVLKDEIKKIEEVDRCLKSGPMTFEEIFDILIEGDCFALFSQMVMFIKIRSHLYEVRGDVEVLRTSDDFRSEMLKFLRFLGDSAHKRITVDELRRLVKENGDLFVKDLVDLTDDVTQFTEFLRAHGSLIEAFECAGEEYISLRGTMVSAHNVFIPRSYFASSVVNSV